MNQTSKEGLPGLAIIFGVGAVLLALATCSAPAHASMTVEWDIVSETGDPTDRVDTAARGMQNGNVVVLVACYGDGSMPNSLQAGIDFDEFFNSGSDPVHVVYRVDKNDIRLVEWVAHTQKVGAVRAGIMRICLNRRASRLRRA